MRIERLSLKPFKLPGIVDPEEEARALAAREAEEAAAAAAAAQPEQPIPEPPKTYTEDDLARARKMGYDEGFMAGREMGELQARQQTDEINSQLTTVSRQVEQRLYELQTDYRTYLETQSHEITKLAIAGARKVAGAALAENPLADVEAMVRDCVLALVDVPTVSVTVNPALAKVLEKRLQDTLSSNEENIAQVTVSADPTLAPEECRIEWKNGGAERELEPIWNRVEAIMKQYRPMSVTPFKAIDPQPHADDDNITILRNP